MAEVRRSARAEMERQMLEMENEARRKMDQKLAESEQLAHDQLSQQRQQYESQLQQLSSKLVRKELKFLNLNKISNFYLFSTFFCSDGGG